MLSGQPCQPIILQEQPFADEICKQKDSGCEAKPFTTNIEQEYYYLCCCKETSMYHSNWKIHSSLIGSPPFCDGSHIEIDW